MYHCVQHTCIPFCCICQHPVVRIEESTGCAADSSCCCLPIRPTPGNGHQEVDEDECWSLGKGVNDEKEVPTTGCVAPKQSKVLGASLMSLVHVLWQHYVGYVIGHQEHVSLVFARGERADWEEVFKIKWSGSLCFANDHGQNNF